MQRGTWCFAAALAGLLSTTMVADATPIEYSFSGTGDWTLNGLEDSGDFVVNLTGDTSDIQVQPGQDLVVLSGTFGSSEKTVDFTEGGPVDFNALFSGTSSPGAVLFAQVPGFGSPADLGLTNSAFETYDLSHALPLTSGTPAFGNTPFFTSGGPLQFHSISALGFQATIIPEPSTWAMMVVGFTGLGFAGYRSRRSTAPKRCAQPLAY
jgi:hypothetical protein